MQDIFGIIAKKFKTPLPVRKSNHLTSVPPGGGNHGNVQLAQALDCIRKLEPKTEDTLLLHSQLQQNNGIKQLILTAVRCMSPATIRCPNQVQRRKQVSRNKDFSTMPRHGHTWPQHVRFREQVCDLVCLSGGSLKQLLRFLTTAT